MLSLYYVLIIFRIARKRWCKWVFMVFKVYEFMWGWLAWYCCPSFSGRDELLPSREEAERLSGTLPNCRIRHFKDNGHTIFLVCSLLLYIVLQLCFTISMKFEALIDVTYWVGTLLANSSLWSLFTTSCPFFFPSFLECWFRSVSYKATNVMWSINRCRISNR